VELLKNRYKLFSIFLTSILVFSSFYSVWGFGNLEETIVYEHIYRNDEGRAYIPYSYKIYLNVCNPSSNLQTYLIIYTIKGDNIYSGRVYLSGVKASPATFKFNSLANEYHNHYQLINLYRGRLYFLNYVYRIEEEKLEHILNNSINKSDEITISNFLISENLQIFEKYGVYAKVSIRNLISSKREPWPSQEIIDMANEILER